MTQSENIPETVLEGDEDVEEASKSEASDDWDAQWQDFGELPSSLIPEFNVALADFIIKQTQGRRTFPEALRTEGGIHSYERFINVFNRPYPKIIGILGGKVSTDWEKEIVMSIALANFLKIPDQTITDFEEIPEYTDFRTLDWSDYLADNRRTLTNEYRQALNTHSVYENNSRKEYALARSLSSGSKSSKSSESSSQSTTRASPPGKMSTQRLPPNKVTRNLTFDLASPGLSNLSTPGGFMQ